MPFEKSLMVFGFGCVGWCVACCTEGEEVFNVLSLWLNRKLVHVTVYKFCSSDGS